MAKHKKDDDTKGAKEEEEEEKEDENAAIADDVLDESLADAPVEEGIELDGSASGFVMGDDDLEEDDLVSGNEDDDGLDLAYDEDK